MKALDEAMFNVGPVEQAGAICRSEDGERMGVGYRVWLNGAFWLTGRRRPADVQVG